MSAVKTQPLTIPDWVGDEEIRDPIVRKAWLEESTQPRCDICGRFAKKEYWSGQFIRWYLTCFVTDGDGGYEHG